MQQLLQSLKTGETRLIEAACPQVKAGHMLVQSAYSLVSAGTERMLVEFGKSNLLQKARSQPDKVKQVLQKAKTDGVLTTMDAVKSKLETEIPLGYCNVGTVIAIGNGVSEFEIGDRVISNGSHADVVCVPKKLCAKVPEGVSLDEAVFTVLGAIALQGIRLIQPTLGERFVVMGLGLVGLLTVQLLRANGCQVLAVDKVAERLQLAAEFGAETIDISRQDLLTQAQSFCGDEGVDGILLCAATKSNEPVHQAATLCRKRGRIVCVGVVGLELSRADFYEKELSFQVSCSYGPGRYDAVYEQQGVDYPIGFVRWTENRNFQAVLQLLQNKQLNIKPMISEVVPFERATEAYTLLAQKRSAMGIVLKYSQQPSEQILQRTLVKNKQIKQEDVTSTKPVRVAVIGAGNYAKRSLIPALLKTKARRACVVSSGGVSAAQLAQKFQFTHSSSDVDTVINDTSIDSVIIATQHHQHAAMVCQALDAGKAVFVEKPLAINQSELETIKSCYQRHLDQGVQPYLMVGFNRRYAPLTQTLKMLLSQVSAPMTFTYTVNAGAIAKAHWTQDPSKGGGRLVGEACHFVDLLMYLTESDVVESHCQFMDDHAQCYDTFVIQMKFANGSLGTIHYHANGHHSFAKEKLSVFASGKAIELENFRMLRQQGFKGKSRYRLMRQDKGQTACMHDFINTRGCGQASPMPFDQLCRVTQLCLDMAAHT